MNVLKKDIVNKFKGNPSKRRGSSLNFFTVNPAKRKADLPLIWNQSSGHVKDDIHLSQSSIDSIRCSSKNQSTYISSASQSFSVTNTSVSVDQLEDEFQKLMEPFTIHRDADLISKEFSCISQNEEYILGNFSPVHGSKRLLEKSASIEEVFRILNDPRPAEEQNPPEPLPIHADFSISPLVKNSARREFSFVSPPRAPNNKSTTFSSIHPPSTSISSSKKTPIPNKSRTPKTNSSTLVGQSDSDASAYVIAVTEGRGHASGEVGIAAMDPRRPHLVLCQISDTQRYVHSLAKMNLFHFVEVLVPNTFVEGPVPRKLFLDMLNRFPAVTMNQIQRKHFNETNGLELIQQYCSRESESVMHILRDKFYALSAAAALLKYIQFSQNVMFAPRSLNVEFQTTDGAMIIDIDTASRLELVMGLSSQKEAHSLLGVLKTCHTRGGIRLLRANILQPPALLDKINSRLECVTELILNPVLFSALEGVISKFTNAESLLSLCMHPPQQDGLKAAEHQVKYTLLLKSTLEIIPSLVTALQEANADYFQIVRENLNDVRFKKILDRVMLTVEDGAAGRKTLNQLQACFMIKPGINGLLDIARKTYCEISQEIADLITQLKDKYNLPLRLGVSQSKGYHIQLTGGDDVQKNLPAEFILVQKCRSSLTCYTTELVALDQRCQQALNEIKLMTNVLLFELLNDIRNEISCLFPLCEYIAELDVCIALAHLGGTQDYIRPTFGGSLNLRDARHPILDITSKERIVANDITADTENNFVILTGPNQSGKSVYIRQIALLQVMAQIGSYVPAKEATFRLTDRMFSRLGFDDNIEGNASTLMVEMQDMEFIRRNLTQNSLVIVDELCRGTSIEEGTCLAFAIAEQLIDTTAFVFFTTHFMFLTKLQDIYCNVRNFHFESLLNVEGHPSLRFTHRMLPGVTQAENYGVRLADLMGFPKSVIENAQDLVEILRSVRKPECTVCDIATRYKIAKQMLQSLPNRDPTWDQILPVIQLYSDQYKKLPPENDKVLDFILNWNEKCGENHDANQCGVPENPILLDKDVSVLDTEEDEVQTPSSKAEPSEPSERQTPVSNERMIVKTDENKSPLSNANPVGVTETVTPAIRENSRVTVDNNGDNPVATGGNIVMPVLDKPATSNDVINNPKISKMVNSDCTKKMQDVKSMLENVTSGLGQVSDKAQYYQWKYSQSPASFHSIAMAKRQKSRAEEEVSEKEKVEDTSPLEKETE